MIWAVSLLTYSLLVICLFAFFKYNLILSFTEFKEIRKSPLDQWALYLNLFIKKHATLIAFAENQLSPKSVSFSLPIASHPSLMQQTRVRPSFKSVKFEFSLLTIKSSGFGFKLYNFYTLSISNSISLCLLFNIKLAI